jgi:hypothetical protein
MTAYGHFLVSSDTPPNIARITDAATLMVGLSSHTNP